MNANNNKIIIPVKLKTWVKSIITSQKILYYIYYLIPIDEISEFYKDKNKGSNKKWDKYDIGGDVVRMAMYRNKWVVEIEEKEEPLKPPPTYYKVEGFLKGERKIKKQGKRIDVMGYAFRGHVIDNVKMEVSIGSVEDLDRLRSVLKELEMNWPI